jgi:hypothetical protein
MRVLVACEFSGVVRRAFRKRGHDAWSCDLMVAEDRSLAHFQCDCREVLHLGWDLLIAHPPCTYLASSGARWFKEPDRQLAQREAVDFFIQVASAPVKRIALENPIGVLSTILRRPDQIVQPWWFGHPETKATCLWLKGLPLLQPTRIVSGREPRCHREAPGPDRWKRRSRTYEGVAAAMAAQWGCLDGETKIQG